MNICKSVSIMIFCLLIPTMVPAEDKGKVAVLPFRVHSLEPIDHLKIGLQEMITVRMAGKGFHIIDPDTINRHPKAFLPVFREGDLDNIGKDLETDWLILGSLTQLGKKMG